MRIYYWLCRRFDALRFWCRDFIFRLGHGFSRRDVWNMDTAAARWFIPRLRWLRDHHVGYPGDMTDESWTAELGKMTRAFELAAGIFEGSTDTEAAQIEESEGLDLFIKRFHNLWD